MGSSADSAQNAPPMTTATASAPITLPVAGAANSVAPTSISGDRDGRQGQRVRQPVVDEVDRAESHRQQARPDHHRNQRPGPAQPDADSGQRAAAASSRIPARTTTPRRSRASSSLIAPPRDRAGGDADQRR